MTTTPDRHAWARRRHLLRAAIGETLALDLEALTTSLLAAVELALEDEPHTPAAHAERPQDAPGGERGTDETREAPNGPQEGAQRLAHDLADQIDHHLATIAHDAHPEWVRGALYATNRLRAATPDTPTP